MYEKSPCQRELMKPKAAGEKSLACLPTSMDPAAIPLAITSELNLALGPPPVGFIACSAYGVRGKNDLGAL